MMQLVSNRHRFHKVSALRALMHAARSLRENGNEMMQSIGPFTLAKTKIQKTWVFCCTVYTTRKTHLTFRFLARKAHARKNPNILFFW